MKPLVLCILDGVGIRKEKHGNAVKLANIPTFRKLIEEYPHCLLEACGTDVGLPEGQMGNSEVGHTNIGAGRIVYQPLEQINRSINDNTFFNNEKLLNIINDTKNKNSKLHIFGLLSDGGVHSHINHLFALLELCKKEGLDKICIHIFLDGRDTLPTEGIKYIKQLEEYINKLGIGSISTISGRYYAMDRDSNFDRIKKSYDVITKKIKEVKDYKKYILDSYKEKITDEFIVPIQVNSNDIVEENDNLITFNFRPDRLRELFGALTNKEFNGFETIKYNDIKFISMFPITNEVVGEHLFDHDDLKNTLGYYLNKKKIRQLRIAETEKYAHVTYFFDGGKELKLKKADRILIPSPKVKTYDLKPSMSAVEITDRLIEELDKNKYKVIILNYANGDMVGHTGNLGATIRALETLDECLDRLYKKVEEKKGTLIVTADHGNSDYMLDDDDNVITSHSMSKVPFIVTNKKYKLKHGKLSDIAPTMLDILNIKKPKEMTGESLITNKKKKINYFAIISIFLIAILFGIYTYRFIHYYRLENNPVSNSDNTLSTHIINNNELSTTNEGLILKDGQYIFKGNIQNNYISYSGRLFRIIKINDDKSIKIITDDIVSSLVWNYENNKFDGSYIDKWLNDNFYKTLSNPDNYIQDSDWCVDKINKESNICKSKVKRKIGLITYQEYKDSNANKGYLNINKYFWTISGNSDNKVWYVFAEGGVGNNSNDKSTYYSYGVRPTLNLKPDINFISGDGSKENPYIIEEQKNEIKIGSYVKYSDLLWKVIEINETYKLVSDSYLKLNDSEIERQYGKTYTNFSTTDYYNIGYYLNNTFYNSLDNKYIVDGTYYTGAYGDDYNYQNIYNDNITAKVGLLNISETGYSDLSDYFVINPANEELVYKVKEDGTLYASNITDSAKIVPVINISKEVEYEGTGTKENPYIIK